MSTVKFSILLSSLLFISSVPAILWAEGQNELQCNGVVKKLNEWSRKHGYSYTYKLKDNDTIEVSTLSNEWCRVVATHKEGKSVEVSYTLKNKLQRPASQIDAYFNNHVEHPQIFPLTVSDWCRGVGCITN